jgi:hypothetical protein
MKVIIVTLAIFIGIQSGAWSQKLDYPELNVTPKASNRLAMETAWEQQYKIGNSWALMTAGLGTLFASASVGDVIDQTKDPDGYAQTTGYLIGALSLGLGAYVATSYRPFAKAKDKVGQIRASDTRGKLTRERIAEEELRRLHKIGLYSRITLSVLNIFATTYIEDNLTDDPLKTQERDKASNVIRLAQVTALLPLLFSTRWEDVYNEQMKYKKRIYAPVSYAPILNSPFDGSSAGGLMVSYRY